MICRKIIRGTEGGEQDGDTISRQLAIDELIKMLADCFQADEELVDAVVTTIKDLPAAQPTLYGYKIEHLAYIARVMQKEGVTAEYAVRTFGDISRASRMIIEELQEKVEKSLSAMQLPSAEPEIIQCKDCMYGGQDEVGRWFCRSLGCQIGNEDGSGYCADAERRTDERQT